LGATTVAALTTKHRKGRWERAKPPAGLKDANLTLEALNPSKEDKFLAETEIEDAVNCAVAIYLFFFGH